MNAKVFILILNYNNWQDTIECLQSVQQLDYPNFRIVVLDNGSADGSLKKIDRWARGEMPISSAQIQLVKYDKEIAEAGGIPELETALDNCPPNCGMVLIDTGANLGYAGGNNVGIRYALKHHNAELIWILNNDTKVLRDSLTHLVERMEQDKRIGMCGSTLIYHGTDDVVQALGGAVFRPWLGTARHIGAFRKWDRQGIKEADIRTVEDKMDYVVGASILVSRQFIEDVGLMSEDYFLYYEEIDWAIRGKKKGYRLAWAPDSIVYHKEGATIGSNSNPAQKSYFSDYWGIRNRIVFTKKFFPWWLPTVYLGLLGSAVKRVLRGQPERVLMILKLMGNPIKTNIDMGTKTN